MYTNGRVYEGEFENDRKHGKGYEKFQSESIYDGMYINGKPEGINSSTPGYGKFVWGNGESYVGEWFNGMKHGQGKWSGSQGDSYNG